MPLIWLPLVAELRFIWCLVICDVAPPEWTIFAVGRVPENERTLEPENERTLATLKDFASVLDEVAGSGQRT